MSTHEFLFSGVPHRYPSDVHLQVIHAFYLDVEILADSDIWCAGATSVVVTRACVVMCLRKRFRAPAGVGCWV